MGALEQAIEAAIQKVTRRLRVDQVLSGTVSEVGETSCTVTRDDAPDLYDVRLNAIDDSLDSFLTIYPAKGSAVLVGLIEGLKTEAVVLRCSEVERVKLRIGEASLLIDKDGFSMVRQNESLVSALTDLVAEIQKIVVVIGTNPNIAALEQIKTRLEKILK